MMPIRRFLAGAFAVLALAGFTDRPAEAKELVCHKSCKVRLTLVDGKPALQDDPIVIARGSSKVHVNWRAPKGWEFADGGVALKASAPGEFAQWCASDVDDDNCTVKKAKGRRYHCLALNNKSGTFAYRVRLRKIDSGEEHEIDPTIVNQGR